MQNDDNNQHKYRDSGKKKCSTCDSHWDLNLDSKASEKEEIKISIW